MMPVAAPSRTRPRVSVNVPWNTPRCSPYVRRLYAELIDRGVDVHSVNDEDARPDILHMHWPEACLGDRSAVRALRAALRTIAGCIRRKAGGTKIVWTVHNLRHHERFHPFIERAFWVVFTRLVDGAIHLSVPARTAAFRRHPHLRRTHNVVIPHGDFRDDYPDPPTRAQARARYGIGADSNVTLFFGQIRPYKNVVELIDAFTQLPDANAVLIIAGAPVDRAYTRRVIAAASTDPRIQLQLGYIDDADVPWIFAACDRVALPYADTLNSGTVMLAVSMNRHVVVPSSPQIDWVATIAGADWLKAYDSLDNLTIFQTPRPHASNANLCYFDWERISEHTRTFYNELGLNRGAAAPSSHPNL